MSSSRASYESCYKLEVIKMVVDQGLTMSQFLTLWKF